MVFVTARVHPGESPSSFVCQGLTEYLLGDSPGAKILRDNIIFKIGGLGCIRVLLMCVCVWGGGGY